MAVLQMLLRWVRIIYRDYYINMGEQGRKKNQIIDSENFAMVAGLLAILTLIGYVVSINC